MQHILRLIKYIKNITGRFLFQLYIEGRDGNLVAENEICACKPNTVELTCAVISPVPDSPCNTDNIFYRWEHEDNPSYIFSIICV